MLTCTRLGEHTTEYRYAPDGPAAEQAKDGGGKWLRASFTVVGASLFAEYVLNDGPPWLGILGTATVLCCTVLGLKARSRVKEESLVVVRDLGLQVSTRYLDGRERSTFLDKAKIRAVFINEGITMHRAVFYLAFVVEGSDRLIIAFEKLRPRLEVLVEVYRGAQSAIFGGKGQEPPNDTHELGRFDVRPGTPEHDGIRPGNSAHDTLEKSIE